MRKVLVDADNKVVNVIEWEDGATYEPPSGLVLVDDGDNAEIGSTYDPVTKVFTPPAATAPEPAPPTAEEFAALQSTVAAIQTVTAPTWVVGKAYAVGNVVTYQGVIYKCIQAHTSQADWAPSVVPALWGKV